MKLFLFAAIVMVVAIPGTLFSHGVKYEIISHGLIGVKAMYDTGQPMTDSKTLIFSPGETKPWLETVTDKNGTVCFKPDEPGTWIIQVREKMGHGMRINLTVDESFAISDEQKKTTSYTKISRKVIIAVCVVWGFIGTALYFKSKRKSK